MSPQIGILSVKLFRPDMGTDFAYRQIGHFQSFGPMGVESNISWTELKDQDLGNWAVHNQQELQRVTTGTK